MEVQQYSTSNTDAIEKRDGITFVSTWDCHIYVQCEIEGIKTKNKQKTNKKQTKTNKKQTKNKQKTHKQKQTAGRCLELRDPCLELPVSKMRCEGL